MEEDKKTVPQFLLSIMVRNPFEALPGFAGSNPGEAPKEFLPKPKELAKFQETYRSVK